MTILVLVFNCLPTYRRSPSAGSNKAQRYNPHPVNCRSIDQTIKIVFATVRAESSVDYLPLKSILADPITR
jgi:hypothetical protein